MPRSRFCRVCRDFHDLEQAWPAECAGHFGAPVSSGPQIISDTIEPFRGMHTGKVFSSKSAYRQDLKARGYIEVGNERVEQRRVEAPRARGDIQRTIRQLGG